MEKKILFFFYNKICSFLVFLTFFFNVTFFFSFFAENNFVNCHFAGREAWGRPGVAASSLVAELNPGSRTGRRRSGRAGRTRRGPRGRGRGPVRGHSRRTARWRRTCSLEHRARSRGPRRGPSSRCSIRPGRGAARGAARPP